MPSDKSLVGITLPFLGLSHFFDLLFIVRILLLSFIFRLQRNVKFQNVQNFATFF